MKRNGRAGRVKVTATGTGLVSRSGVVLWRELCEYTGLVGGWTAQLLDTYRTTPSVHAPGQVLADLAVSIADGGDALSHLATLRDQDKLFGAVASDPTAWRVVNRVDAEHLERLRMVRAQARERAWAAGGGPDLTAGLTIDIDATITLSHSEKQNAAATWKRTFGFHPLLAYLDRPDVCGGEGLAGMLRSGNAGSNTAADHTKVLAMALAALPEHARPRPGQPDCPRVLIRTDSAGATYAFAAQIRASGCGFSLGFPVDASVQAAVLALPEQAWQPALDLDGDDRDGAWVAEITGALDLSKWPTWSRVIIRRERPHPGAQMRFTDSDGHRFTAFITDSTITTEAGQTSEGELAELEVEHRSHARVEDRIRCGKDTGLRNMPCKSFAQNEVWLELSMTAADLITWSQALCFDGELARCEPATLRYRICGIAGRLTHSGRQRHLQLDRDWPWVQALTTAFNRLRTAPWPG